MSITAFSPVGFPTPTPAPTANPTFVTYDVITSLLDGINGVGDETWRVANVSTGVENNEWVLIVDAVILSLTIVGALMIIISMGYLEWRGRPSTTRMRLVQSLVVTDLALGITGLTGVSLALGPKGLDPGQACDGLGVMIVAVLWSEHLWTLSLAIATFMILIHPIHPFTLYLEKNWWHSWVMVWVISFAVSVAGYVSFGVAPSGGICYYPAATAPLYGPLMQFIPRAFVFIVVTVLYARLFVFLRRPDKIRSHYSNSPTGSYTERTTRTGSGFRPVGVITNIFKRAPPKDFTAEHVIERIVSTEATNRTEAQEGDVERANEENVNVQPRTSEVPSTSTNEIPPWERVELPMFQVDGQRFGGSISNTSNSGGSNLWGNWKGLGAGSFRDSKKRMSASSYSPPARSSRRFGSGSSVEVPFSTAASPVIAAPRLDPIRSDLDPLSQEEFTEPTPAQSRLYGARGSWSPSNAPSDPYRNFSLMSGTLVSGRSVANSSDTDRRPSALSQDSRRSSGFMLGKREKTFSMQTSPTDPQDEKGKLEEPSLPGSRRGSENVASGGEETGNDTAEEDEDGDMDLMRMLRESAPPRDGRDRFAPPEGETVELVEESMASYLNRKTALLMLWFPLGYILLFSVSLIRIIYDFTGRPPTALRAVSRWFIFAQGILDALIYGLVEWHTKRIVRKRVKKGTFSQHNQSGSSSWPRALRSRRGPMSRSNLATHSGNGQGSSNGASGARDPKMSSTSRPGVTFGWIEERSILRELDLLEEVPTPVLEKNDTRRGSGKDSIDTKTTIGSAPSAVTSDVTQSTEGTEGTDRTFRSDPTDNSGKEGKVIDEKEH